MLVGASGEEFTGELVAALGLHRAWERAADVMASAVAPSKPKERAAKEAAPKRAGAARRKR